MLKRIQHIKNKTQYFRKEWKQILHVILQTRYFGVNNQWRSSFPSLFGKPPWRITLNILLIFPLVKNYRRAKYRAETIGFIHPDTSAGFGWKSLSGKGQ